MGDTVMFDAFMLFSAISLAISLFGYIMNIPILTTVFAIALLALYVGVYALIYADAKRRNLNAPLWLLITFFMQIPIGPLFYVLACTGSDRVSYE